jgi:amino-acid N-acetyltransferase
MQTWTRAAVRETQESRVSVIRPRPVLTAAKSLLDAVQLPTADLTEAHCDHFFYWGTADAPSGLVGLELFGEVALLRSLAVSPGARSSGMGTALVQYAENNARTQGVRTMYLLTTTAEGFFLRLGYVRAPRDAAPAAIRATREFSGMCPASAAFLSKQLCS